MKLKLSISILTGFVAATLVNGCASSDRQGVKFENAQMAVAENPYAKGMVASANPHATQAGIDILRAGGTAADAAVAVQTVLSLVEPQKLRHRRRSFYGLL